MNQNVARGGVGRRTIHDVALAAGVSTATVSRVTSGNYPVAKATRARVERAMRELGYVANANARALARSNSNLIGIIISDMVDPFFAYVARGVEIEASSRGLMSLVCPTRGAMTESDFVDMLLERRAALIVLVGGAVVDENYHQAIRERHERLAAAGSRLVLCGRPGVGGPAPVTAVEYDNVGGARAITDLLLNAGHRRILYLGGPPALSTTRARVHGFVSALADRGIDQPAELIRTGQFSRSWAQQGLHDALDEGADFTAVFAANDIAAAGVYAAARERGLRIPQDLSVVGYDDVPVARELNPGLTTVEVPLEALGREAVRAGLRDSGSSDPQASDEPTVLGTRVIHRESVAAPNPSRRPSRRQDRPGAGTR
ncbi:MAG: LacI family transcriptional regulator [Propionibacteriales bacterium]|nr:LacI family transcriptional regulator [Propionibacteriales bacterium]